MPARVKTPHKATSDDDQVEVFVPLIVEMNTLANIIAPIDMFTIPPIKLDIFHTFLNQFRFLLKGNTKRLTAYETLIN